MKRANDFFYRGQHGSASGTQQGEFLVDHRDAEFALNLAMMLLAYLSRLLV